MREHPHPLQQRPIHAPISTANAGDPNQNQKGWAMTEQNERPASARAEIAARVASFKAMQEKFQRERDEYFAATLENARNGSYGRRTWR